MIGQTSYPGAPDTADTLIRASDWPVVTQLRADVLAGDTAIPVQTTARLSPSGVVVVRGERIAYAGLEPDALTGCTRGAFQADGGSTPQDHPGGAEVVQGGTSTHHRVLADAILAVEGAVDDLVLAGGYSDEQARDAVAAMLTDSASVAWTKDDVANAASAAVVFGATASTAARGNHQHAHADLTGIDTDQATNAVHHTLGAGANQAAAGNHQHAHSALTGIDTDGSAAAIHHTLGAGANQAAAGNHTHPGLAPVGSIVMWPVANAPSGWLLCDGSAFSQATYAALFAVLGSSYDTQAGAASPGAGQFRVPNMKGRVPTGRDAGQAEFDALGETGGAKDVTLSAAQSGVPAHGHTATTTIDGGAEGGLHQHNYDTYSFGSNNNTQGGGGGARLTSATTVGSTTASGGGHVHAASTSVANNAAAAASQAHTNLAPYATLNFIIRAV